MSQLALLVFWICVLFLIYSNIVYPAVVGYLGLSKWYQDSFRGRLEEGLQPITLLVPAFNESAVIQAKLKNIEALDYPAEMLRIIVASDGSDDGTQDIVRSYQSKNPLELLDFHERRGKASVVNDALSHCVDPWICLSDANVMFRPDALSRLGSRLQLPGVGAVTGDVRLENAASDFGRGERLYYLIERAVHKGESLIGSVMGVDGGMYLMRRELFKPLPKATILDDFTISMTVIQQGYRIQYEPDAIAHEDATPSSEIEFGRRKRLARGAVQSILLGSKPSIFAQPIEFSQWFSHKLLRWLNPLFLVGILTSSLTLAFSSDWFRVLLGIELLVIGSAILAWFFPKLRDRPVLGVIYYLGLTHWAMLIGLIQGLSCRYSGIWNRTERSTLVS
jgi:biofilm PGA synthesis N-glycosyltransferase PgaC